MSAGAARPRVLVVDDNLINNELVRFVLEAGGFEVDVAVDAAQALELLAVQPPDLVLMDIQMPGMSGLELTRRLKADTATRRIPVVAFTAYAMKGDEARLREAGCDGYISKPIDVATFAQSVKRHLGESTE